MSKLSVTGSATGYTFEPIASKNGKISRAAERQADALNTVSRAALLGIALTGKGAMRTRAAQVFKAEAVTLQDYFDSAEQGIAVHGSRYGELRSLIAADLGAGHLTPVRGKAGCMELCHVARLSTEKRYLMAETEKQQSAAQARLDHIAAIAAMVKRHYELSAMAQDEAERVNADAEVTA